jgi:hypothetical protein
MRYYGTKRTNPMYKGQGLRCCRLSKGFDHSQPSDLLKLLLLAIQAIQAIMTTHNLAT